MERPGKIRERTVPYSDYLDVVQRLVDAEWTVRQLKAELERHGVVFFADLPQDDRKWAQEHLSPGAASESGAGRPAVETSERRTRGAAEATRRPSAERT